MGDTPTPPPKKHGAPPKKHGAPPKKHGAPPKPGDGHRRENAHGRFFTTSAVTGAAATVVGGAAKIVPRPPPAWRPPLPPEPPPVAPAAGEVTADVVTTTTTETVATTTTETVAATTTTVSAAAVGTAVAVVVAPLVIGGGIDLYLWRRDNEEREKQGKDLRDELAKKRGDKARRDNADKAPGPSPNTKIKKKPCVIGPYKDLNCPKQEKHHIVPDYVLRWGKRHDTTSRITDAGPPEKKVPSLDEGPSICLDASEHDRVHRVIDKAIRAAGLAKGGYAKLGDILKIVTDEMGKLFPECRKEIEKAIKKAFKDLNKNMLVRTTQRLLPKPGPLSDVPDELPDYD